MKNTKTTNVNKNAFKCILTAATWLLHQNGFLKLFTGNKWVGTVQYS